MDTDSKPASPTTPAEITSPTDPNAPAPDNDQPQVKIDSTKDLWANIAANVKEQSQETSDQTVLVVGVKQSGKTSVIQRMLGATSSNPKATTALEYSYGKKEERNVTQIAHFWELAQGMELSQLSDVVIVAENIHSTLAVVVVDCQDVSSAWVNATFWMKKIDSRAQELFQKMRAKGSQTPDKLLLRAKKRIGENHPDASRIRNSGIPTVLVCNRLDKWKHDTGKLKHFARSMRFLAHIYGASLIFTSDHEREATKLRALLNHLIFQSAFDQKYTLFDTDKGGLLIPAGSDTFVSIGDPVPCNMAAFKPTGDGELDRWKAPFDETFQPRDDDKNGAALDKDFMEKLYSTTNGYGEPLIDAMRKQKDSELEQYRKAAAAKKADKTSKSEKE